MTEQTNHAGWAREFIRAAENAFDGDVTITPREEPTVAENTALAQVHATLALVEQQRIANLIALVALSGNENVQESSFDEGSTLSSAGMHALIEYVRTPATPFSDPDDVPGIRPVIREGLGL